MTESKQDKKIDSESENYAVRAIRTLQILID